MHDTAHPKSHLSPKPPFPLYRGGPYSCTPLHLLGVLLGGRGSVDREVRYSMQRVFAVRFERAS